MKSENAIINEGWYRGLPTAVQKKTKSGKPLVLATLKSGDISTPAREQIVKEGVRLAKLHLKKKEKLKVL